jgi:hypothetical protein
LHSKSPEAEGFTPHGREIEGSRLHLFKKTHRQSLNISSSIWSPHSERTPNPGACSRNFPSGKRRLFIEGDTYHSSRSNSDIHPRLEDLPLEFRPLLDWYKEWNRGRSGPGKFSLEKDPLLALAGTRTYGDADTTLSIKHGVI